MSIIIQCSSLFLLGVILFFYITQKRVQLNTERAYLAIWLTTIAVIIFDIASTLLLNSPETRDSWITPVFSKIHLASLIWVGIMAHLYIIADIYEGGDYVKVHNRNWLLLGLASTIVIMLLKATPSGDYGVLYHVEGGAVDFTYAASMVMLVAIGYTTEKNRDSINQKRREATWLWLIVWLIGAGVQYAHEDFMVTSFAGAIGVMIIYIKLENPESNIDRNSGLFNSHAIVQYVRQLLRQKSDFTVVGMIYDQNIRPNTLPTERKSIKMELVHTFDKINGGVTFRVSQDEILIVFKNPEEAEPALKKLKDFFEVHDTRERLQVTGVAWVIVNECIQLDRAEDLLKLFAYLRKGGKRFNEQSVLRVNHDTIAEMYHERDMEALLEDAVKTDRFEVFYQPIYSNESKSVHSAEALVRIRREDGSLVPPGAFIELAERNGAIVYIGESVFRKVCQFIHEEDIRTLGMDYIEINLSVVQACKPGLAERYIEIMEKFEVDPKLINLEITESAPSEQRAILLNNMEKLLNYGVQFSLDDFGTGQSNLNYIVDMPVDIIKFDRNLINAYFEGGKARFVMDAAMQMIKSMDLSIVAEGIETREQLEEMQRLGIRFIQGYYFAKPMSRNDFLKYIMNFENEKLEKSV